MPMRSLIVVGASGFGREVLDVVEAINRIEPCYDVIGVLDDAPSDTNVRRLRDRGYTHLGGVSQWRLGSATEYVIGIGAPAVRRRLATALDEQGLRPAVLVHPAASIGSRFLAGPGTVVCAGALISTNVTFGAHVHINPGATIGHDSRLGDFVSVNPGAIISGECAIEPESLVGAGAVVLQNVRVGAESLVGAAACVVRDVPPGTVARGVPARAYPRKDA